MNLSSKCSNLAYGIALVALTGSGASLRAQSGGFAYVANAGSNNISAYSIDGTTGVLMPVSGSPFLAGSSPIFVRVDPFGDFVYVANCGSSQPICGGVGPGNISAYTIDAAGALTNVGGSPFSAGSNPISVAVDSSAQFVYGANFNSNDVSAYTINATTGALTPVEGSPFSAGSAPTDVAVDPSGRFVYVVNCGNTPPPGACFGVGPGNISAYTINATTGALTPVEGSPFAARSNPVSVAVDPSGRFVYVTNVTSNDISAYMISATTGALTDVLGSPFPAGSVPSEVAVDPSGQFVYVANCGSLCGGVGPGKVSAYTIDTTGALTPVEGSPFSAGSVPVSVAVNPTGLFAYVANLGSSDVSGYSINGTTGALTPLAGSPFAAGLAPFSVTTTAGAPLPPATAAKK